ncbi:hypothetical protein [Salinisphaera sp. LB1]|uniref:hypothetical protein n=1 Tax=Salinisphaera sp. LB1 TaxID=2183911 RepID=UPI000D705FFF|nr:hypothetical protein [Salinisphaera sp. LB1]AWN16434.1 hypothetical protein SALB1_2236 [Salinisphaera sp. LB1]
MTHRNLFSSIALTASAVVIGLASANADAHAVAGNYQDHKLPSATRHTANVHHDRTHAHYARVAQANRHVEAGNYQDHVVSHATRRNIEQVKSRNGMTKHEVAMSDDR